jgi:hypothetical protein
VTVIGVVDLAGVLVVHVEQKALRLLFARVAARRPW